MGPKSVWSVSVKHKSEFSSKTVTEPTKQKNLVHCPLVCYPQIIPSPLFSEQIRHLNRYFTANKSWASSKQYFSFHVLNILCHLVAVWDTHPHWRAFPCSTTRLCSVTITIYIKLASCPFNRWHILMYRLVILLLNKSCPGWPEYIYYIWIHACVHLYIFHDIWGYIMLALLTR